MEARLSAGWSHFRLETAQILAQRFESRLLNFLVNRGAVITEGHENPSRKGKRGENYKKERGEEIN